MQCQEQKTHGFRFIYKYVQNVIGAIGKLCALGANIFSGYNFGQNAVSKIVSDKFLFFRTIFYHCLNEETKTTIGYLFINLLYCCELFRDLHETHATSNVM